MAKKSKQEQVATEIDRFFGGWKDDPRTTEEIMQLRSKKNARGTGEWHTDFRWTDKKEFNGKRYVKV